MGTLANQGHFNKYVSMSVPETQTFAADCPIYFCMGYYKTTRTWGTVYYEHDDGTTGTDDYQIGYNFVYSDGSEESAYYYYSYGDIVEKEINGTMESPTEIKLETNITLPDGVTITNIDNATIDWGFYYFDSEPVTYIYGDVPGGVNPTFAKAFMKNAFGTGDDVLIENGSFEFIFSETEVRHLIDPDETQDYYNLANVSDVSFDIGYIGISDFIPYNYPNSISINWNKNIDLGYIDATQVNFEINTAEDLFNMRYSLIGSFQLMSDIDLTNFSVPSYHPDSMLDQTSWENNYLNTGYFPPIYSYYERQAGSAPTYLYSAKLEGNGFAIENFTFKDSTADNIGLFRNLGDLQYNNGTTNVYAETYVRNLKLLNVDLEGYNWVAGIVGRLAGGNANDWQIEGVKVEGNINTDGGDVAGLACYVYTVGGGTSGIRESSFIGNLGGGYLAAGIVGYSFTNIKNCYARGTFEATDYLAGISGYRNSSGTAENNYFAGTLNMTGSGETAPMFIDAGYTAENIINNYYDSDLIGITSFTYNLDGEKARTTEQMTYGYDESTTYLNWDFGDKPTDLPSDYNDGYPELVGTTNGTWWIVTSVFWNGEGICVATWNTVFFWVKVNDEWEPAVGYVKNNGIWEEIKERSVKGEGGWS